MLFHHEIKIVLIVIHSKTIILFLEVPNMVYQ
jgi:hypothetical protein